MNMIIDIENWYDKITYQVYKVFPVPAREDGRQQEYKTIVSPSIELDGCFCGIVSSVYFRISN